LRALDNVRRGRADKRGVGDWLAKGLHAHDYRLRKSRGEELFYEKKSLIKPSGNRRRGRRKVAEWHEEKP